MIHLNAKYFVNNFWKNIKDWKSNTQTKWSTNWSNHCDKVIDYVFFNYFDGWGWMPNIKPKVARAAGSVMAKWCFCVTERLENWGLTKKTGFIIILILIHGRPTPEAGHTKRFSVIYKNKHRLIDGKTRLISRANEPLNHFARTDPLSGTSMISSISPMKFVTFFGLEQFLPLK